MNDSNPDVAGTLFSSGVAYLAGLAGISDPVIIEAYCLGAGIMLALSLVAYTAPKGRRLGAVFMGGAVGLVSSILVITFTPAQYYFLGLGFVVGFCCVYWGSPLLNTLRHLLKDKEFIKSQLDRRKD